MNYLCCQINGDHACTECKKKVCSQHIYRDDRGWGRKHPEGVCTNCYSSTRERYIMESKGTGMTFKQLYLAARKIMPTSYLSVSVSIEDHNPGINNPEFTWTVYCSGHGHAEGKSPEEALFVFERKINGVEVTDEQIDV